MRIPPSGYLTLALLCGELICVMIWAFTGTFFVLAVGIAAGVGCVISAVRWKD
jgi:membrane-bound ClpP family serine protease